MAAAPSKAAKGYVLGSLFYAAIMFSLPLCIGLAVWALDLPVSPPPQDRCMGSLFRPSIQPRTEKAQPWWCF